MFKQCSRCAASYTRFRPLFVHDCCLELFCMNLYRVWGRPILHRGPEVCVLFFLFIQLLPTKVWPEVRDLIDSPDSKSLASVPLVTIIHNPKLNSTTREPLWCCITITNRVTNAYTHQMSFFVQWWLYNPDVHVIPILEFLHGKLAYHFLDTAVWAFSC